MAYQVKNINILDLKPSTAIGVSIPFSSPSVFTSTYTTQDQLKSNIINYLLTGRRERVFQPTFGAEIGGLRGQLFEQLTDESLITINALIKSGIEANFSNVNVTHVQVVPIKGELTVNVSFKYSILNTGQTDQIILNFENG